MKPQKFSERQKQANLCYRNFHQGKLEAFYVIKNLYKANRNHFILEKISEEETDIEKCYKKILQDKTYHLYVTEIFYNIKPQINVLRKFSVE